MNDCIECYKIKCRGCGWEPNDHQIQQIKKGELTTCPTCGWKPGSAVSNMQHE